MKLEIRPWRPTGNSALLVNQCNEILAELSGYRLTLRQLYYQLVSRNVIPNLERSYQNLSRLVTRARMAGLIDWDLIEDRVRTPWSMSEFENIADLVDAAVRSYRLPRWKGQSSYAELWVEKDALAGVLRPLAAEFHVTLMVNRGYSSASAMKASADRYLAHEDDQLYLFYLGDFDPSGEDMVRDISARLYEFTVPELDVQKVALTWEQIQQYNPPPNPAKHSDPRSREFIRKHGSSSWEVDALPPQVLEALIRERFEGIIDRVAMDNVIKQEELDKEKLRQWAKKNTS